MVLFLIRKDEVVRPSKFFQKDFRMKKVFASLPSDQTMVESLIITLLKFFVIKMAFLITSPLLELLNKMG